MEGIERLEISCHSLILQARYQSPFFTARSKLLLETNQETVRLLIEAGNSINKESL